MSTNILEDQANEYLRLNGFFLIPNFVIHLENAQAQEIDLLGIRLAGSVEQTMESNGGYAQLVFQNDERLELCDNSDTILLIGEVTESSAAREIKKRIDYLRDTMRIGYSLQRFGVIERTEVYRLIEGKAIRRSGGAGMRLLRVLFVLNDKIAEKYQELNEDLVFLSQEHILGFINKRAKINIKERARILLPRWLHDSINRLLQR
jgi:hypothetical protein